MTCSLENHAHLAKANPFFVCGDVCVPAEIVQLGVFRCLVPPQAPGIVNFYLSFDGHHPVSQVVTFEYRAPLLNDQTVSSEDASKWEEFQLQMRLSHLLFSTSRGLNITIPSKLAPNSQKDATRFASKASFITKNWANLIKSVEDNRILFSQAKDLLFELALMNKLLEWLMERVVEGVKTSERDGHGQGVIHLCAMLGYTRAVYLYSLSGLSLDYRDKCGWTALHWAAYYGRYVSLIPSYYAEDLSTTVRLLHPTSLLKLFFLGKVSDYQFENNCTYINKNWIYMV